MDPSLQTTNAAVTLPRINSTVRQNIPLSPRRPSEGWLKNPSWIDGGLNPAHFYITHDEIQNALLAARLPLQPGTLPEHAANSAPPVPAVHVEDVPSVGAMALSPLALAGHLVSVTMSFTAADKVYGAGRVAKLTMKKTKSVKSDHVVLNNTSRTEFLQHVLRIHDLTDQYSPGVHMGPGFKFAWTGSPGGKTGATTIETDHEWEVARSVVMKKNKDTCGVTVEIDIDTMDGFRIRKRAHPFTDTNEDEELVYGTKVPRFDTFSDEAQLHAPYILLLKNKWTCQKHQGEHGQDGHCYIGPSGEHLGLNNFKLKKWAASIAAGDSTKHEPPNTPDFDGARDGRLSDIKPRGHTGPRSASTSTSSSDATAILMAAILPLITGHLTSNTTAPLHTPSTQLLAPSTPPHTVKIATPLSPAPDVGMELHSCIGDFLRSKGIDLIASEPALMELELTPDIVADVPVARLCEVMGAVEGRVRKFQVFCKEWNARLEDKKRRAL